MARCVYVNADTFKCCAQINPSEGQMQCSCLSLVPQWKLCNQVKTKDKEVQISPFFSRDKKVLSSSTHHCKYSHKMTNLNIHQKLTCKLQTLNHNLFASLSTIPTFLLCKLKTNNVRYIVLYFNHTKEQNIFTIVTRLHFVSSITSLLNLVLQCSCHIVTGWPCLGMHI